MTELEIAAQVATHPLVIQYRKATQIMHRKMVSNYGQDYGCPEIVRGREKIPTSDSQRGHSRMTEADENLFNSLLRGAAIIRRDVRASILATA